MSNSEIIMKMIQKNNGTITSAEVTKSGIHRGSLKYLVDQGVLERSSRGVYVLTGVWDDEFFNLQIRFKKGIFSGETSLFLNDLTDRTPNRFQMTFPAGYNTQTLKNEKIKFLLVKKELYNMGVAEVLTPSGNPVKVYGIERTLCDILRGNSNTDIQVVSDAFKRYVKSDKRNIPLLSEYAKKLRVSKKLQAYLEVLI